jgi:hypothetical protein
MKRKNVFTIFALLFFFADSAFGQNPFDFWRNLRDVSYEEHNDPSLGKIKLPVFGEKVTAFENKTVTIKGYIMPLELGSDYIVISAYPFENCYFCGAAGPETVMEVFPVENIPFANMITVKGILKLNRKDIHRLYYRLENAVLVR